VEKQRSRSTPITVTLKDVVTVHMTHADGPDHTHNLRASDILKRHQVAQFIEAEASKGYRALAIKGLLPTTSKTSSSVLSFSSQKVHGVPFIGADDLVEDQGISRMASVEGVQDRKLRSARVLRIRIRQRRELEALRKSEHIVIMDSTHKPTNKAGSCIPSLSAIPGASKFSSSGRRLGYRATSSSTCRQLRRTPLGSHFRIFQQASKRSAYSTAPGIA